MANTTMRTRCKVAVVHPQFGRGGSDATALWTVEALKGYYDVTVITGELGGLMGLNAFCGTGLVASDFSVRLVPRLRVLRGTGRFAALRGHILQQFCQQVARDYDVLISAYNVCDCGRRAIQLIADLSFDEELRGMLFRPPPGLMGRLRRNGALRTLYLALCRSLSRPSGRNPFRDDLIVANSQWTARIVEERFGASPCVLYPPVEDGFPAVPSEKKEVGFVCVGAISAHKEIERIIEMLSQVRGAGHSVHLHVIGQIGGDAYGKRIRKLCEDNSGWVFPEGRLEGRVKKAMLGAHRYGIHACQCEAFGIAVAEMVKAGCIPFVPCEGGQAEIVNHQAVTYSSVRDGVAKITAVLRDDRLQEELRAHLANQANLFGVDLFRQGIRDCVSRVLTENSGDKDWRHADQDCVHRGDQGSS